MGQPSVREMPPSASLSTLSLWTSMLCGWTTGGVVSWGNSSRCYTRRSMNSCYPREFLATSTSGRTQRGWTRYSKIGLLDCYMFDKPPM
ncbi:hypothetical protein GGS26DRAFT_550462 [Hypomontagnella submonticulosa]|nr:hypothetical protein GGS26DRAFT_550462 [Hypomontagnella submonticulosa]